MNQKLEDSLAKATIKQSLMFIPNLLKLLYRLGQDHRVSSVDKALLLGTAAYVLSPWDLLPDMIPFLGQIDDLMLIALVLKRLMDSVDYQVLTEYWDGNEDLLNLLSKIVNLAVQFLPPGIYHKLIDRSRPDYYNDVYYRSE